MEPQKIFDELFFKTDIAFDKSVIKKRQREENEFWYFSICATPIQPGRPLLMGLNWGAIKGVKFKPQTTMPDGKDIVEYKFVKQAKPYFEKYMETEDPTTLNYSNLCFFRTPDLSYLAPEDWDLSISLFEDYVDYIKPSFILMLGSSGMNTLRNHKLISEEIVISSNEQGKAAYGYRGKLFEKYSFYCLPHPRSQIYSGQRNDLWRQVFPK